MYIRKIGFLVFCSLVLLGCQQDENAKLGQDEQAQNNRYQQVKQSSPQLENEQLSNTEIANHLTDVASSVPDVNQASAIVAGPYTVVAINVDEDIDRARVGTIKYAVSEALYHDPYGKTAVVIADADLTARLRGMGDKINQGYPVMGVVEELAAIVGRYMPEFPVNDDQPREPDDNKEILSDDERKQLEEIEEEQSNDVKQ